MTATDTYLLLRAFCDELGRCGVEHACTSPGSRCTPVVLSLAREPRIRCWSHIDERSAAFFALGAAKASGRAVALTCTSGTAAANFLPAVIEAHWARVPLIVLTADRPPELRGAGAGQTIDQLKLFGDAVKWFVEVGVHDATPDRLRWMRALACRAYWTAVGGVPGPVHLNFPLREPLVLEGPLPEDRGGRADGRPWIMRTAAPVDGARGRQADALSSPGVDGAGRGRSGGALPARGVVVAGRDERLSGLSSALARFAARAGYALLADPLSGARRGPAAIGHYDLLLREPGFVARMRPDIVLRLGDLPTSKPLRTWLSRLADVRQIAFDPEGGWQDPATVAGEWLTGDPAAILEQLAPVRPPDPAWLDSWRAADGAVAGAVADALGEELSEPMVARALARRLGSDVTLFVASSMPIRDLETFLDRGDQAPRMMANRGANGIDGTVSSAFGVAATGAPTVLLIGDVALAHDIGGLLAARRLALSLTVVLINNDGGGIFHFLPVAAQRDAFEEHVATPHGLRFELAAELYGCAYAHAATVPELHAALDDSFAHAGTTIIEVRTDREANLALHRRVSEAATEAVTAALAGG